MIHWADESRNRWWIMWTQVNRSQDVTYTTDKKSYLNTMETNNNLLARYTHSTLQTDDVLAVDVTNNGVTAGLAQNTATYLYLKNDQGTITDIADNAGNKLQHYVYSAFGILLGIKDASANDVTASPPVNTSYTYTGREQDKESGFYYYRARYYDPATGRFLQRDPELGKLSITATVVNSYAYVLNNSANLTDPSGRFPFLFFALFALGGSVAHAAFTGDWSIGNLAIGALKGLALGAAVLGVAAIIGGISGAIAPGAINGITLNSGGGFLKGLMNPGTSAYIASGILWCTRGKWLI